ncbi:Ig-like domain-containing protein [Flavobacterium seoulense]|uniref:Ig-like domain-containing protein n=1 Tax=Flavobacterium seoulense TaxID=1492738 RepID=A0A066WM87_9FLAO|nr:T9SS type B sorting domain-containing protein [Flavobacterium seoulense]KDN53708.1 hypothetical protein FEM21_31810 [Flavobacterium seoulense]
MKRTLLLFLFLFSSFCFSQENCNNGIDDDGDGKIDLNDTDCICNNATTSLLQNHSFEEKTGCPQGYDDIPTMKYWYKGTIPAPEYLHKDCFIFNTPIYEKKLQNFPDGNGIIGALYKDNKKEYIATKLSTPLIPGINYQLTLNIATLMSIYSTYLTKKSDFNFLEPTYVTLYGCNNKDNFPLYTNKDPNTYDSSWIEIGKVLYQPQSVWSEVTINFSPNIDINAIMLGPEKNLPTSFNTDYEPSFLYDNLRLNTAENFGVTITQSGAFCNNDLVLKANLNKAMSLPTTFQWYKNGIAINGATNQSYSIPAINTNLGEYAVKVTDVNNCFISSNLTINNSIPKPSVTVIQPSCQDTNAYIKVNETGVEYSFEKKMLYDGYYDTKELVWQTDANFTTKDYGIYYVRTRTSSGCISTPTIVTIDIPTLLDRPAFSITQPTCSSGGTITITTPGSQYSFDDGLTWKNNATKTNLPPGNYFIKIKNNSGCESYAQSVFLFEYYINSPTYIVTLPTCNEGGSITITTSATEYSFDNGETWSTNPTATNLLPGYYNVRIKDEFGCESKPFVNQIYFERFSIPSPEIKVTQPDKCDKTGSITFLKTAAQYSLDDGATWTNNQTINNLPVGGSYIIKTKNELGCESERNYATIYPYHLPTPSYTKTNPTCEKNGNLTITTNAFEYSFDNGKTWTKNPTITVQNGTEYSSFPIMIKDEMGCTSIPQYITVYSDIYLDFYPEYKIIKGATCDSGASITITTAAAEYSFDGGDTWSKNPTATNLLGGNSYALKVKDSYGCVSYYKMIYIPFNVNESYLNIPTYTIIQPSCENKKGTITITTPASFYSFDGGETWGTNPTKSNLEEGNYEIVIKNETGCKSFPFNIHIYSYFLDTPNYKIVQPTSCETNATGSITITSPADYYSFNNGKTWTTNPTATNLPVGFKYQLKIKNNLGCESERVIVEFTPVKLRPAEYTVVYPSCGKGGSITVTTPAPFYSFDGGETWGTNPTASNLPEGHYYPHPLIKNELGCVSQSSYSINFHVFNIVPLNIQITQPTCESKNKGSISINTPFEQYSFDDGRTWSQYNTATNLAPGNYTIKVKNNLGCQNWGYSTVTLYPFYLPIPNYTKTNPTCGIAGSITITNTEAFYSFDNGETWGTNPTKSNLTDGNYIIKTKNELGCESHPQYINLPKFYLNQPTNTIIQPNCESLGSITFTTIASQYSIDNGINWSSNASFTNLVPGNYYLKIKNDLGCESNYKSVTLYNVNLPAQTPTISIQQPSSCTTSKGKISITTNANLYSFDNGLNWSSNPTATDLAVGDYFIKIKNSSTGCPSPSVKATINPPLDAIGIPTYTIYQPISCTNPFGTINITTVTSAYSFDNGLHWTTNPNSGNLPSGQYKIKTKNSAGCESEPVTIQINAPTDFPNIPIYSISQPDCNNFKGKITITTLAAEYSFDNGITWNTSAISTLLNPGEYFLKIKNANGCISQANKATIIPFVSWISKPIINYPQTFCIQQNATLNDIAITGQNVKWYDALTNGTNLLGTTSLENGKTYYASQTINSCESERIAVSINIQNTLPPTADTNQSFCTGSNPTIANIQITGNTIKWYDALSNGSLLAETTNLIDGKTYYASQTINNCESERFGITVSIVNTPTVPTVNTTQSFCKRENATLANVQILGQNIKWYDTNFSATTLPNTTLLENNKTYYASQTIGCESDRIPIIIRVYDTPLPSASNNQQFCIDENATITNLTITGSNIRWYDESTNGTVLTTTTSLQNGKTYYAAQTLNNCESERLAITVNIQDTPVPIANSPQIFCIQKNAKVSDIVIAGQNINWFETEASSVNLSESTLLENGIIYYASQTINGCESNRIPVSITILGATTTECINYVDELPYPKFFTPNNDGYNDTWTIDFAYLKPNTGIQIFDRYGKLIKVLLPNGSWNGQFNNQELPATDYWFIVTRANGQEYKGHFSLKR